jgi:phenylalanyl-tRNA synthetase beta chain
VVGLDFDPQFVGEILRRLEFDVEETETGQWLVHAPGFRPDIELEDDLVEEVARHHGYDNIPSTYPAPARTGAFLETKGQEDALATLLRGFGCFEAVNYVFSTPAREAVFWGAEPPMVPISNPLTEEDTHLRTILTPGLVECVRRNLNHGTRDVRLFEFGRVFRPESAEALYRFREFPCLGVIGTGTFYRSFWSGCRDDFSFYHLKGMVERVFEAVGRKVRFERNAETPFLHPGVAARVLIDDEPIGVAGKLHPRVREKFKFLQSVFLAEFSLEKLYSTASPEPHYRALSRFPTMERDLSFVVDKSVEYDKIDLAIKSLNVAELVDIRPIDLYQGSELPPGKVSVAVRLTFAHALRTLTQEEVNARTQEVWEALSGTLGAERRA